MKILHYAVRALVPADGFTISMPEDALILCVVTRDGELELCVQIDPNREYEERNFRIYGQGYTIDDIEYHTYVGSYTQIYEGLTWHLYERTARV